jgi:hypothetical protein
VGHVTAQVRSFPMSNAGVESQYVAGARLVRGRRTGVAVKRHGTEAKRHSANVSPHFRVVRKTPPCRSALSSLEESPFEKHESADRDRRTG